MVLRGLGEAQAEIVLYFDGREPGVDVLSDNVRVIYSGGHGANRADGAILADIKERHQRNSNANYIVVTSDMDLAAKARKKGAEVFLSETLADLLFEADN